MTAPSAGYPDYQRLSTFGGVELKNASGTFNDGSTIFSGFVGTWAYLDIYTTGFSGPSFAQFTIAYYTDSTFTTQVGTYSFIRAHFQTSQSQYAVLAPWCKITINTDTGAAATGMVFNIYGSQGSAGRIRMGGSAGQLLSLSQSFAAGAFPAQVLGACAPGPGLLHVFTQKSLWFVELASYSWSAKAYNVFFQVDDNIAPRGGTWPIAIPDAPLQVLINNSATSAQGMTISVVSTAY